MNIVQLNNLLNPGGRVCSIAEPEETSLEVIVDAVFESIKEANVASREQFEGPLTNTHISHRNHRSKRSKIKGEVEKT